jgi:copper chaperone
MTRETRTLHIGGMTCGHCVAAVRRALEAVPGVVVRDVHLGSAEIEVEVPEPSKERLVAALEEEGYRLDLAE